MTYGEYIAASLAERAAYDRWFWQSFVLLLGGDINMLDDFDPVHARQDDAQYDHECEEIGR
jgi:hypothetical protein